MIVRKSLFIFPFKNRRAGMGTGIALLLFSATILAVGLGITGAMLIIRPGAEVSAEERAARRRHEGRYVFVPFDSVVVNLKGERLTRFLQASISFKVNAAHEEKLEELLEERKVVFQNWLITHLSDKYIDDVEGAASMRELQREIEDGFNALLAEMDVPVRIEAVLFEEFNVQ